MASFFFYGLYSKRTVHLVSAFSLVLFAAPQAVRAQLHVTGFSYTITSKGISHRQQLRQSAATSSDRQLTVSNLDAASPSQFSRLDAANPDLEALEQQTLNNQRTESRSNALILSDNFTFSVFRGNQYQPPN